MQPRLTIYLFTLGLSLSAAAMAAHGEGNHEDSAAGLPRDYAKNYLIAESTMSVDKKFAVIYPTLDFSDSKEAKDLLVSLKPFKVLAPLSTEYPYFQRRSNSGISAEWSKDDSVALITIDSKWGPGDVFVVEVAAGQVKRTTNILDKLSDLLRPKFKSAKPKPEPFNDSYPFIFEQEEEGKSFTLEGTRTVKVNTIATNDPKGDLKQRWRVRVKAEWDIAQAKFTSQEIRDDKK